MGALVALVVAGGLSAWALARPWRHGFALLVGVTVLVPATIGVPNPLPLIADAVTVQRAVLLALVVGMVLHRSRVPEVARDGVADRGVFEQPPVVGALGVYVLVTFVVGLVLAAPPTDFTLALLGWLKTLDQLLVLGVAIVLVRVRGVRHAAVVVAAVAVATALLAGLEAVLGRSLTGLLFDPAIGGRAAVDALEARSGGVRVRVGAEFALQLAWMLLAMLPLAVVGVLHRYRDRLHAVGGPGAAALAATAVVGVLGAAILATRTRSALLALPLIVLLLALLVRWTAVRLALPLVATAGAIAVIQPEVLGRLTSAADPGAIAVRFERLPSVLAATSDSALLGLGFEGLDPRGFPTTDVSYLLAYAETGAVGLVLLLLAGGIGLAWCLRGLRGDPTDPRHGIASAGAVAVVAMLLAGAALDAFHLGSSARLLWIVVAVGGVASERLVGRHRLPELRPGLVTAAGVVGLLVGLVALVLAPRPAAARYLFTTVPTETEAVVDIGGGYTGLLYSSTVCDALTVGGPAPLERGECRRLPDVPGGGEVRLVASTPADVVAGADAVQAYVRDQLGIEAFSLHALERPATEPPSALRAAPVWVPLLLVGLALVVPARSRDDDDGPPRPPGARPPTRPMEAVSR